MPITQTQGRKHPKHPRSTDPEANSWRGTAIEFSHLL